MRDALFFLFCGGGLAFFIWLVWRMSRLPPMERSKLPKLSKHEQRAIKKVRQARARKYPRRRYHPYSNKHPSKRRN